MKHAPKFLILLALLVLVLAVVNAQDALGPGEGGTIFLANSSDDPDTFNPLLGGDTLSSSLYARLYPNLFGVDPFDGTYAPGFNGSLATSWEYNEDGTVLTINLREDAVWNDGVQITAQDYVWGVDALRSGLLDTPRGTQMWEVLDDGTPGSGAVVDVQAIDDFTLQVTFAAPDCVSIGDVWPYVLPSHVFDADFGDDLAAMNDEPRYLPGVSWGPWKDLELVPGDNVSMIADQSYPDAELGYVSPSELVILNLPNLDVTMERFRAGEITIAAIPGNEQAEFVNNPDYQTYRFNRAGYVFYAFNLANPDNPMPGFDENGEYIEQDPHPVLADVTVRKAISMAVDVDAIIENSLGGNAARVGIGSIPVSWDWNPDLLYPFDPVAAAEMLDEAGWVLEDGDFRVCRGCAYSEIDPSYEGTEMALTLNASSGSSEDGVQLVEFIAQSLRDVGINAEANFIDWATAFLPELDGQTFDMAILAWSFGVPLDPDTDVFRTEADVPGSGFNFGSYQNPEVDQLYRDARNPSLTDGCSLEGRKAYYDQINEIIFDEVPYLFLYSNFSLTATQADVQNWNPATFSRTWQEDSWVVPAPFD